MRPIKSITHTFFGIPPILPFALAIEYIKAPNNAIPIPPKLTGENLSPPNKRLPATIIRSLRNASQVPYVIGSTSPTNMKDKTYSM